MLDPKPRQHFKSVLDLYPDDIKSRFINLKARYLLIGSAMSDRGEKFVEKIFQNTEIFNFSENDLRPLTRSDEHFDCFIIGGKDAARIVSGVLRPRRSRA